MEHVKSYTWKKGKLKGKTAKEYTRKSKPKEHKGIHKAETTPVKIVRYRDNQGRVVRQQTIM